MTMLRHLFLPFVLSASVLAPAAFAVPVPVPGDAPVPVDRVRLGNPSVLAMTGTWRFKLEQGISPALNGELPADAPVPAFAAPDASDADWKNIPVPANWEIEGFSPLTYQDRATNQANQSKDIGLYRRLVDIPASFAGQRGALAFRRRLSTAPRSSSTASGAATTKAASPPSTSTSPRPSSSASGI